MARKRSAECLTLAPDAPFHVRLWYACAVRDITDRELARLTGLSKTTVSSYVCGRREPRVTNLVNIARAVGVSVDWLCGMVGDR